MSEMPPYLENKDEDSDSQESYVDINAEINDWDLPIVLDEPRHNEPIKGEERVEQSWRLKEKYKTHCVALVLCLNVGVDPPDVVKTQPCARVECWIDPHSLSSSKALESIGHALQLQYERWQPRARYKQSLDPTCEEVKKLCCSLRRNAKDERVLFHYNGHGVPKPTAQGEIWVFNKTYTQYIPLSMYDLQSWMGAPSLYVYDCSNAGVILDCFKTFAEQHERDYLMSAESGAGGAASAGASAASAGTSAPSAGVSFRNCVQLGACAAGQTLPMNPELPADLFTSCLTTPVKCALKWFVLRGSAPASAAAAASAAAHSALLLDLIDKIPGQVTDRRTMLGELNWIFTAITDTIAWNSLPPELFQQLFRADLLTASLCRNFLLADRIMRCYNCTPVSMPALPALGAHPLWGAWEHTLELALAQLPRLLHPAPTTATYRHAPFFQDHLRAFRLWLRLPPTVEGRAPPAQLPLVLQVLLSTAHRVPALALLCRYLGHASTAVGHVLRVGVFPYTLKLLQASASELQPPMLYIWSHIIAYDPSCQVDLVNAKGHKYFLAVLSDPAADSEQKAMALFVLAGIVDNYPAGQEAALNGSMISLCLEVVSCGGGGGGGGVGAEEWARWALTWACCALGRVWRGNVAARAAAARDLAHEKLLAQGGHSHPVVRASVAWALGRLLAAGSGTARSDHSTALDHHVAVALCARALHDASPLVRHETLAALQWLVLIFEQYFIAAATQERLRKPDKTLRGRVDPGQDALEHKRAMSTSLPAPPLPTIGFGSVYAKIWSCISTLCSDPSPRVRDAALALTTHVTLQVEAVSELEFEVVRHNSGGSPDTRTHSLTRGHRRVKSLVQSTISEESSSPRDHRDSTSSSTGSSSCVKKAIVTTELMEWVTSVFVRSVRAARVCVPDEAPTSAATGAAPHDGCVRRAADGGADPEARDTHERQWRYARNREMRHHMQRLRAGGTRRVEGIAFSARAGAAVSVLAFHPYCQQLCVATREHIATWDWGAAARLCTWSAAGAGGEEPRVSALCYVNAHESALAAAATAQGDLMLFRVGQSTCVSAWHALDVRRAPRPQPPPAAPHYSLGFATLVPEQFLGDERGSPPAAAPLTDMCVWAETGVSLQYDAARALMAVAGNAPHVALWDLASETRALTLPTEGGVGVTSLWWSGWRLACGLADGTARVADTRAAPRAATHHVTPPHAAPLRLAALRDDLYSLVTVCAGGVVQVWDTRGRGCGASGVALHRARLPSAVLAAAAHPAADMLALACANQSINILDLRGHLAHSIRFHDGFMGARIAPPSTLAFHPLRVALGVGSKDSTVSVYVAERR